MIFYVGLHHPSDAKHFDRAFLSVNVLRKRRSDFGCPEWIMDSGAFTEVSTHGRYREGVEDYAAEINRWFGCGLVAAVSQDWMCEPWIVEKTGLSVRRHQELTIERYDAIAKLARAPLMPVLQGYQPEHYLEHLEMYGPRLAHGAYVGVGSVCKRNTKIGVVESILWRIKERRPDLLLHGFGLKATALTSMLVQNSLHSADSMAWSYSARKQGRNQNDWREAKAWIERMAKQPAQYAFPF